MAARTGTTPGPLTASNVPPPVVERAVERAPAPQDSEPSAPLGEVSDDFVATGPTRTAAIEPDAGPAVAPQRPVLDTPVTADARSDLAPTPAVASAVSVPTTLQHQMRVEDVLRQYARAYAQLDARAARAVWPTVNERALARAFRDVASQNVRFDDCEIDIRGASANALCRGTASYVPKVGNREQRTEERSWRFELRLDGDAWQIVDVNASRQSSLDSSR